MRSFIISFALSLAASHLVASAAVQPARPAIQARDKTPLYPYDPNTTKDCTFWWDTTGVFSCESLLSLWGLTNEQFVEWNPSITAECGNFKEVGQSYCVEASSPPGPTTAVTPKPTTSTTSIMSTTSTKTTTTPPTTTGGSGNGVATPTPFQEGMTSSCNRFRLVNLNDQCGSIASQAGISLTDFYRWNPAVGSECTALWSENYVCIGIIGSTPSPTEPGNNVPTPTPTQPGMTNHCNKFRLVKSGDQCGSIASQAGISLAEFYEWNPAVGRSCSFLWADSYVCIGLLGCTLNSTPGICGRIGFPVTADGSGELSKHTTGPFVSSTSACSGLCMETPGCTGFHFTAGSYCSIRYGPVSFTPNGNPGSSEYYQSSCISCPPTIPVSNTCPLKSPTPAGKQCGRVGVPVFKEGMGRLLSFNNLSAYVSSVGACAAQCLGSSACTSFYFTQAKSCNLFYGPISFSPNGNPGSEAFYDADCFPCHSTTTCSPAAPPPPNTHCGRVGVPVSSAGSGTLIAYDSGPYVTSLEVCAAQCMFIGICTGFYYRQGQMCSLQYGPVSFSPNGSPGSSPFWDAACFPTC